MTRPPRDWSGILLNAYVAIFLGVLLLPLLVMCAAAFNTNETPSVAPWQGFTWRWFAALADDDRLITGFVNSLLVAAGVIAVSLPLGFAGAVVMTRLSGRGRSFLYALLMSPMLIPGIVLGISTLIFWRNFGLSAGLIVAMLAQSSFIAAYCMLIFMARLQRFDRSLEEAALDLGASRWMMVRRILLPFVAPTAINAAFVAFLQSFENYNTTAFSIGGQWTLVTEIGSRFRFGLTPAINAIGVIFAAITIVVSVVYVWTRRPER